MARGRGHGVVDGNNGNRADAVPVLLYDVELGNFFVQRAAGQGDVEGALFEFARFFLQAGRATVLGLVVALNAVMSLV